MTFWKQTEITDAAGNASALSVFSELRVAEAHRLCGGQVTSGTVIDPNFFAVTVTGSGSATASGGLVTLATGTTANSSASLQSVDLARYVPPFQNFYQGEVILSNTGVANNVRRWGAFNGSNGVYFKLSGTVLNICTMDAGVETAVPSSSWNRSQTVPVLNQINLYQIFYTSSYALFVINLVPVHVVTATAGPFAASLNYPSFLDNTNSGGGTSNVSISFQNSQIARMGPERSQPKYFHGTTAATTNLKLGSGTLHRVTINNPTTNTLTIYDSTTGSGTVIAAISLGTTQGGGTYEYGVNFYTGLTVVSTGGGWDYTVIFE